MVIFLSSFRMAGVAGTGEKYGVSRLQSWPSIECRDSRNTTRFPNHKMERRSWSVNSHEASPFLRERDDLYCPDSLLSVIPLNRIIEMGPPSSFEGCENPSMHFAVNIVGANIGRIV